jgi:hypothetical protein
MNLCGSFEIELKRFVTGDLRPGKLAEKMSGDRRQRSVVASDRF